MAKHMSEHVKAKRKRVRRIDHRGMDTHVDAAVRAGVRMASSLMVVAHLLAYAMSSGASERMPWRAPDLSDRLLNAIEEGRDLAAASSPSTSAVGRPRRNPWPAPQRERLS